MEAILFIGLPGSGKSSFYKERFFNSHVRISLDLLKTRHRENRLLETCLDTEQRFVIDNTNPTKAERSRFIERLASVQVRYKLIGYYFESKVEDCLNRNAQRSERVPDVAILSAAKKLELPSMNEGFDELFYVRLTETGFVVEEWKNEI
ncbi:ATP-binding protein [Bremerella cremea]|uniref:ATP-binding protein n=1 Tax=Bremerella cremea TaxID=1031537 RepID=A0A368KUM9_9BACT|nr:AAA family ATPase [Bremerella cremea]RCS54016.1 ATP-binding protein [Bremerella cremea]